ncbi:MAG: hypothetical protein IKC26_06390 [Clostridia bacterium]|nr:hypothetical protein [Clostridia bacterium]
MDGEKKKILSFWQDKRHRAICHRLVESGYRIGIAGCTLPSGMPQDTSLYPNYREALRESDIVLLPLPSLRCGRIAFSEEEIPFSEFLGLLREGTVLLCGMLPREYAEEAERRGITVYDYYDSEEVKMRNAVLTAEGALSIAMQELPIAMQEVRAAVVGCGRIGNALCRLLRAMNAEVTAVARRAESLTVAESLGCKTELLTAEALRALTHGYDVVFTTVPSRIFTADILSGAGLLSYGRKPLYVDLSSSPGSFDPAAAREYGIRLLWALSLPGKYAPDSAGRVLADRILCLLAEGRTV